MSMRGECLETSMEVHRRLMEVNYFGHVQLTQTLMPLMFQNNNEQTKKYIVGISSMQGRIALPYRGAYSASKHAFQAYFDSLKGEVDAKGWNNFHVLVVSPGYIRTNLSLNALSSDGNLYGRMDATQQSGMAPEYAAKCIVDAMLKEETELLLADFKSRLALILRAISPNLYFWVVVKRAKKQQG